MVLPTSVQSYVAVLIFAVIGRGGCRQPLPNVTITAGGEADGGDSYDGDSDA